MYVRRKSKLHVSDTGKVQRFYRAFGYASANKAPGAVCMTQS